MKKLLSLLLVCIMSVSLAGCGGKDTNNSSENNSNEASIVMKNDTFSLDAICVDDSYRDEDNSPLRMVYLFYTLTAKDSNLKIDSKYTEMTIDDTNTYTADHFVVDEEPMTSIQTYYYSSYIKDVYTGTSQKVVATFKIPEADLASGKTITLKDNQIPGIEEIKFTTDEIKHYSDAVELAKEIDPEGYAKIQDLKSDADADTLAAVKNCINGYEWSFYVNSTAYKIAFRADNNFSVSTAFGTNEGTYEVKKGFINCTYSSNGYTVEIPYTLENGNINLDIIAAFDVSA